MDNPASFMHFFHPMRLGVLFLPFCLVATAGAQVGPDYERPPVEVTTRFKGVTWREAKPSAHLPKG